MNNSFAINIQSVEAFLVYYLWEVVLFSRVKTKMKTHREKSRNKNKTQMPSYSLSRSTHSVQGKT